MNSPLMSYSTPPLGGLILRWLAFCAVGFVGVFLANAALNFGFSWPGAPSLLGHFGWFGVEAPGAPLDSGGFVQGAVQLGAYLLVAVGGLLWIRRTATDPIDRDAAAYSAIAGFIVRAAFWSVLLVGLADALISFLRVEGFLPGLVGKALTTKLGLSKFRGLWVHYPLIGVSCVIAAMTRSVSVIWLAFLVVLAEFQIVITRFVFSYEQALMGDLVRFWYAALFLIASAYTLVEDGHVRVDVFYARFSERGKARANVIGTLLLGLPLCWVILWMGLETKASSLASPMTTFEISQSGFGMYVKYLMAACLVVFAASMNAQFAAYLLTNASVSLRRTTDAPHTPADAPPSAATTEV